jgi:hypothetical protein
VVIDVGVRMRKRETVERRNARGGYSSKMGERRVRGQNARAESNCRPGPGGETETAGLSWGHGRHGLDMGGRALAESAKSESARVATCRTWLGRCVTGSDWAS